MAHLFIISGPSGVGKTTVETILKNRFGNYLISSPSYTTREKRNGEIDGVDYIFTDKETFQKEIDEGNFIEWDSHYGNFYGTNKKALEAALKKSDTLKVLDVNGALNLKKFKEFNPVSIFLKPESKKVLIERLRKRNGNLEDIYKRIDRLEYEISLEPEFDYSILNKDGQLEYTISEIENIIGRFCMFRNIRFY